MNQPDQPSSQNWFEERFPISKYLKLVLHEEIPGGASLSYSLGSAALFLFVLLALTGIWQMLVYVPVIDHAYESLCYLRREVPFGWLIHGLHYWGSNAFVVVVGLHIIRVFAWGAYKKPRELVWTAGVFLLILTAFFMYTGPILPWDKKGFWACKVGLDILGAIPGVGQFLQAVFGGAPHLGQATLSRMFVMHVAIVPLLLVVFVSVHLIAFRVAGSAGTWKKEKQSTRGKFWPQQIYKDMLVASFLFLLLVGLSAFFPAPFSGMADPLDTTYIPKPEWNFAFLYQLLKYFKGKWEPYAIVGIPLIILLLFFSLPFIDRKEERSPFKRLFVMSVGGLFCAGVLALTIISFRTTIPSEIQASKASSRPPSPKKAKTSPPQSKARSPGEKLFYANSCNACHSIDGKPSHLIGPDLILALSEKKDLTKEWLETQLISPEKHNPKTSMPSYKHLSKEEIATLVGFLEKLSKEKPTKTKAPSPEKQTSFGSSINIVGNFRNGKNLYDQYCMQCHGPDGKPNSSGFQAPIGVPALNPINQKLFSKNIVQFLKNIDPFIQKGAPNPKGGPDMMAFGDSHFLTEQQIADIEAYILKINHVDRSKILHPGMNPKNFFYILLGISVFLSIIGIFIWRRQKS